MSTPRHALRSWKEIARACRRAAHLALFTDFDGTLVRIRAHPDLIVLPERVRRLLGAMARSGVTVGVVSGRKLADLRRRVRLGHIWYVGAHGYFLLDPGNRAAALLTPTERDRMRAVRRALTRRMTGVSGVQLESKEATIAVHYRRAPARSVHRARQVIAELLQRHPQVTLLPGKKVWSLLPGRRTDKWTAISLILRRARRRRPGPWLAVFLGDDATDERVFQKMQGISIVVGRKQRTAARYYLRSPSEVLQFLRRLKTVRK
jgi:trehalose-phosphatase